MDIRQALRAAGVAAVTGGLARLAAPFADRLGAAGAQIAYLVIDIALTLGLIGLYARYARTTGRIGLAAFAVAVAGVLTVRSQGVIPGGYLTGAAVWSLGLAALGLRLLFVRGGPRLAPALWLLAVPAGLAGALGVVVAGSLFALGYMAGGLGLLRESKSDSMSGTPHGT